MNKVSAQATIKDGKLILRNQQIFEEELRDLSGDVTLTVAEGRATRSGQQNRYYWSVVCKLISDFTGYTPEEVHEYYKKKFLSNKKHIVIGDDGLDVEMLTTTRLNTKEFEDYCENIRRHASMELQVNIPEPNQESFLEESQK
jgi:hypothetical protein